MMSHPITPASLQVFLEYAADACNWNGTPLIGGNVPSSQKYNGHLLHLKTLGLVSTMQHDGYRWLAFTESGIQLAAQHGIALRSFYPTPSK